MDPKETILYNLL